MGEGHVYKPVSVHKHVFVFDCSVDSVTEQIIGEKSVPTSDVGSEFVVVSI